MIGNHDDNGAGNAGGGEDLMRYDLLAEAAMKHVVRMALWRVQREGLPGEHHFYIAFDTRHEGVRLSDRLREKYPEEMTIVLQHQFWDLKVQQQGFEVGLAFGGIPEKLWVPFDAITGFYDPSVQFALQFRQASADERALLNRSLPTAGEGAPPVAEASMSQPAPASGQAAGASEQNAPQQKDGEEKQDKVVSLDAFRKKT